MSWLADVPVGTVRLTLVVLWGLGCDGSPKQSCAGCLDDPPRICNSTCLTHISSSDGGGPFECACNAGQCGNSLVSYNLVCDDNFCQCSAAGVVGNAGGMFASPPALCESDVSVIEGLWSTRCNFPPK